VLKVYEEESRIQSSRVNFVKEWLKALLARTLLIKVALLGISSLNIVR
jgi:hypothetical protein